MSVCPVCGGVLEGARCARPCPPQPAARRRRSIAPRLARVGPSDEPICRADSRRRQAHDGAERYIRQALRTAGGVM